MRFYPTGDINHYWEYPSSWSLYCRTPNKSWHREPYEGKHAIAYWRDLEGAKMETIKNKDLYFNNWPTSRIRMQACLPHYYCVGNRFIRLEKLSPIGFKCQTLPLNLAEVRAVNKFYKELDKKRRQKEKEEKRLAKERALAAQKTMRTKR